MRQKPIFVAEVSSNHHTNLERCLTFVDIAAQIGCDAVKFQLFRIAELFAPEILEKSARHRERAKWELPEVFLLPIVERCRAVGIQFCCTPFYLHAVDVLAPHVDFFKIASYELLWDELLAACAASGKPVVLSTGMADMQEIAHAVEIIRQAGGQELTLLHCISSYPAQPAECNLQAIETLRQTFRTPVGWSDHSASAAVLYRAIHRWQADMIEFHLDLDGKGEEYAFGHCWLPEDIKSVINQVKTGLDADGTSQIMAATSENIEREWRADPIDGLRPFRHIRDSWKG